MQDDKDKDLEQFENRIRDERGRFQKGVSGNPGGKTKSDKPTPRALVKQLIGAKLEANNFDLLNKVLDNMIQDAIAGDSKARNELLNRYAGLPKTDDESREPIEIIVRKASSPEIDDNDDSDDENLI